ncbi:putative KN motif and ankyrin repeat domain-containing protein 4 [Scophthalmus maximus]|uniref:Putative KN motif and ankyrin repeat domain-containing protein 4 n=1 Tax=Scophthalmus maximus TaxID=52904 RepID=A0A2U9C204_SCOMX|nr:putative KN motif and ankyrin repeat domain-containing protein 4 [Scophthalmus maximus]
MDKKGANGFQTKAAEGGVPRKQLPYSVETPYGFHLDLDFLKYVDDIEKGNTIKRVHIQRRVKGPPKFSTLPRNFSLPGHGARPASKEKDSTWSGTSTLGPKPKSRVTEVQQIFDFRANEGGTPSQSSRGTTSQGSGWVSAKPREEVGMGARAVEEKTVGSQSRPNLLRASSMPVTLQQRKGSDSSSPDRIVGTPENGSTENMFRPSPDITERRAVPQERTGLHQQITVALKRVRELEEQVKTIPELKAQICSLREEREKLLLQLQLQRQAQAQAQISTSPSTIAPSSDTGSHAQPCAHRPAEGLSLALTTRTTGVTEKKSERLTQPSEKSDKQKETIERPLEHAVQKLSRDMAGQELTSLRVAIKDTGTGSTQDGNAEKAREPEEETDSLQMVQEKLMILEDKLTRASQELENTNSLLKEQIEENKVKEDKIIQLSEGMRVEMCSPEADSRPRRESIDTGTVTEKAAPVRPRRGSSEIQDKQPRAQAQDAPQPEAQTPTQLTEQPPSRGSGEAQPRPTRQGSGDSQSSSQGSRRSSGETPPPHKDAGETPSLRRGSGETAQRRGSTEAQASRRDGGEAQPSGRGSSESPTSPAALGQVVTRLTGLLGEQWAQLGSSSGAQQASQLVSSLSVLSAFYSPAQKAAAAASKQQEQDNINTCPPQIPNKPNGLFLTSSLSPPLSVSSPSPGLKSIMKKNGVADKQGNKGAKKNLKFVGVNGGYETTSSEESSGDEKSKVEPEEEDSSEPEVEKEKEKEKEPQAAAAAAEEKPEEAAEIQGKDAEVAAEGGAAVAGEKEVQRGLLDPESSQELQEEQAEREKVDKAFIDACLYVKDRMEEVSSPDKEMRQVLVVLYQEWFKVSSQKDSQADTVRLYLRQVGLTTPTLLPYVVNLTDGNGNMALHYSVSHSNFPVVKLLLDTGLCETDNVNKAGYTPVMLAALTAAESPDDLEVAQQLLRHGDVNACSRQAGQTALMLAVSHGRVAMVKLLLGSGADANAQDREGSTALMCASEHGHTHIARLLLETGRCDTGLVDKNGQTARSVAEGTSHQEIVDLLKAHAETRASEPSSSSDLL